MRIRYQQLLGLFEHSHGLLVGHRRKIVQKLSKRMATFQVIHQVLDGNSSSHENRVPAKNLWIRMNNLSHTSPFYPYPDG